MVITTLASTICTIMCSNIAIMYHLGDIMKNGKAPTLPPLTRKVRWN